MRLSLAPIKRLLPAGLKVHGRDGLLFQRLFWGAMAGCLATLLLAESPILESMELSMLEWRYKVAGPTPARRAISLIGTFSPSAANTTRAASRMRPRFSWASERTE